jgi:HlyD family secretion protein
MLLMLNDTKVSDSPDTKARNRRWGLTVALILFLGGAYTLWQFQAAKTAETKTAKVNKIPKIITVTALGRLEPEGEVIKLSAPTSSNGNRVDRLLVKEGTSVKAGQVVAMLDSHDRLQAAFQQAKENVRGAQAKLAITQAGAKRGELAAQGAEIERLAAQQRGDMAYQESTVARFKAALRNAQTEYDRYQTLAQEGAVSASSRDSKRLTLETAQKQLQEAQAGLNRTRATSPRELSKAKATLEQLAEVRPVDVEASRVEITRTRAAMNQAQAELKQSEVHSPIDGEVLYVHTRSGEVVSTDGIVEIGQTGKMVAVAEVYQSDISRIKRGQSARVSSDSIPGELHGTVERIGAQVRRQTIVNTDPSSNLDSRVVEVHVALDRASSQKAAKFTNLQVMVVFKP